MKGVIRYASDVSEHAILVQMWILCELKRQYQSSCWCKRNACLILSLLKHKLTPFFERSLKTSLWLNIIRLFSYSKIPVISLVQFRRKDNSKSVDETYTENTMTIVSESPKYHNLIPGWLIGKAAFCTFAFIIRHTHISWGLFRIT